MEKMTKEFKSLSEKEMGHRFYVGCYDEEDIKESIKGLKEDLLKDYTMDSSDRYVLGVRAGTIRAINLIDKAFGKRLVE